MTLWILEVKLEDKELSSFLSNEEIEIGGGVGDGEASLFFLFFLFLFLYNYEGYYCKIIYTFFFHKIIIKFLN